MKVVLAGAYGNLGIAIFRELLKAKHEVVALDLKVKEDKSLVGKYTSHEIDVTKKETLTGLFDNADVVISTVGLVSRSATLTNYDVDLNGNINLLNEAKKVGIKKFMYVSVIKADSDPNVPMLDAKAKFEKELKNSGLEYVIIRPTGYFYDIAKVFMPMIDKGKVTLLGKKDYPVNVIDTSDLGKFMVLHLNDFNQVFEIGGKEEWTYKEIAQMFFNAAKKKAKISRVPKFLFDLIIKKADKKNDGSGGLMRFSKWTLTHNLVGEIHFGDKSFKEYIESRYGGK